MDVTFDVITLFPEFFSSPLSASLLGKAIEKKLVHVHLHNLRDYAVNAYGKVDDAPYGGGQGMVLMVEPIAKALQAIQETKNTHVVLLTPRAKAMTQNDVKRLYNMHEQEKSVVLICGHYEGVDERVAELSDECLRIGDYVLSGGEPAAAVLLDAVSRLTPNFMGNEKSISEESFEQENYIEYPHYTRPSDFNGMLVPPVLLSGNHEQIRKWREQNSLQTQQFKNDQNK